MPEDLTISKNKSEYNGKRTIGIGSSLLLTAVFLVIVIILYNMYSNHVDEEKFKDVERAATALNSAIDVGVNFIRFSELLQDLALELEMAKKNNFNAEEEKVINLYADILRLYDASSTVWYGSIESRSWKSIVSDLRWSLSEDDFNDLDIDNLEKLGYKEKIESIRSSLWIKAEFMLKNKYLSIGVSGLDDL